ncbi:MAG: hypothetical protein CALGDGBN_01924 [Pseudomonadales bacterium]|nr:hypothetical protein [Pseudomonadales bacterium]
MLAACNAIGSRISAVASEPKVTTPTSEPEPAARASMYVAISHPERSSVTVRTGWFARAIRMLPLRERPGHGGEVVRA